MGRGFESLPRYHPGDPKKLPKRSDEHLQAPATRGFPVRDGGDPLAAGRRARTPTFRQAAQTDLGQDPFQGSTFESSLYAEPDAKPKGMAESNAFGGCA